MKNRYLLANGKRILTVKIRERPESVDVALTCDRHGHLGDEAAFEEWLRGLVQRFDNGTRPLVMKHRLPAETVEVDNDFAVIAAPPAPAPDIFRGNDAPVNQERPNK